MHDVLERAKVHGRSRASLIFGKQRQRTRRYRVNRCPVGRRGKALRGDS